MLTYSSMFLKKSFSFWFWTVISKLGFLYRLRKSWMQQALYWEILSAKHKQSSLEDVSVVLGLHLTWSFLRQSWGKESKTNMRSLCQTCSDILFLFLLS